jgi:hypothetical protein
MAEHVRSQLRDWYAAHLVGSAEAGSRVYDQRALPLAKHGIPAFTFALQGERVNAMDFEETQERLFTMRVTAVVKDDSAAGGDTLDAMGLFVERVHSDDPTLGGLAKRYEYQGAEFSFAGDGEKTLCVMAMTFVVQVFTERADPTAAI